MIKKVTQKKSLFKGLFLGEEQSSSEAVIAGVIMKQSGLREKVQV